MYLILPLLLLMCLLHRLHVHNKTFLWCTLCHIKYLYYNYSQVLFEPIADVNNPAPALGNLPRETIYEATGGRRTVDVSDLEPAQEYRITVVTWSNDQLSEGTTVIATTSMCCSVFFGWNLLLFIVNLFFCWSQIIRIQNLIIIWFVMRIQLYDQTHELYLELSATAVAFVSRFMLTCSDVGDHVLVMSEPGHKP